MAHYRRFSHEPRQLSAGIVGVSLTVAAIGCVLIFARSANANDQCAIRSRFAAQTSVNAFLERARLDASGHASFELAPSRQAARHGWKVPFELDGQNLMATVKCDGGVSLDS
jgi:hypothetical protein